MRKGQVEHFFSDIIPGLLILLLAYGILTAASPSITVQSLTDLHIKDMFERELLILLQSPAPEKQGLTYGDWLYQLLIRPDATDLDLFKTSFRKALSNLPFARSYPTDPRHQQELL